MFHVPIKAAIIGSGNINADLGKPTKPLGGTCLDGRDRRDSEGLVGLVSWD